MKKAAFFFGSGISRPSGMPSVEGITNDALTGDWWCHTDLSFLPGPNPNPLIPDHITPAVKEFLRRVSVCASDYIAELARPRPGRKPHYEDLFSLAEQAMRPETDHVPNLAAVEFLRRLRREAADLHCGFKSRIGDGFVGLATAACDYLHWVVHHKLSRDAVRRGLNLISETARHVEALDIFTTNHDLLIEQQLGSDGFTPQTGFDDDGHGEFRVYRSRWWLNSRPRERVRLFKLHGSLNWWRYHFPGWAVQYAIPNGDPCHSKDSNGHFLTPIENKAAFLSGTIVKEMRYGLALWGELFSAFQTHLAQHDILVSCGYGFGDTGINQRILQWLCDAGDHQLVILTPEDLNQFFKDKPPWLAQAYQNDKVTIIPQYLETCSFDELAEHFG
jgi:hypothetical protein